MTALDTIYKIAETSLIEYDLKYCLVNEIKRPFNIEGEILKLNELDEFAELEELIESEYLEEFKGVGISIQASKISAIDIDKCFSEPFDINSADSRAKHAIDMFKEVAYIEFSFSGNGLRILFKQDNIEDYTTKYYIKNKVTQVEYYQSNFPSRYVTVTGNKIVDNPIESNLNFMDKIFEFCNIYLLKPKIKQKKQVIEIEDDLEVEVLFEKVKYMYFKNTMFQNLWFNPAPGSGSNESERDYHLIAMLYDNVTQSRNKLRQVFEMSEFYKTKDWKHIQKWKRNEFAYFNQIYDTIVRGK